MNNARRKEIDKVASLRERMESLAEEIADAKEALEGIRDDEQEYVDNMPESLQQGEKGEAAQEAISQLEEAIEALGEIEDIVDKFGEVEGALNSAKGE